MSNRPKFFNKPEYYRDLTTKIAGAKHGDQISLATMVIDVAAPEVKKLMNELNLAAQRGADVKLAIDANTFLIKSPTFKPGPLFWYGQLRGPMTSYFKRQLTALEEFKAAGGQYVITNIPKRPLSNPIAGRSHIKFSVIGDYAYIGGCNLTSAENIDIMVGLQNLKISNLLHNLTERMISLGRVDAALDFQDSSHQIDDEYSILLDSGQPGRSIILDEALKLIDESEEYIYLACQFFPNRITLKRLIAAYNRGVKVSIVYNHPLNRSFTNKIIHSAVMVQTRRAAPKEFFNWQLPNQTNHYIHAKLLAAEKGALIGSHNLVDAGVKLGTAEIALLSHNNSFSKQAVAKLQAETKGLI